MFQMEGAWSGDWRECGAFWETSKLGRDRLAGSKG